MPSRGVELVEALLDNLECPECSYSLRGLGGDQIVCPECGTSIHVPTLIAQRWTEPWWNAPLYNTLAMPLAWLFVMVLASPFVVLFMEQRADGAVFLLLYVALAVFTWIAWLYYTAWRFGSMEGAALALLVHMVIPSYIGGVGMIFSGCAGSIGMMAERRAWMLPVFLMLLIGGVLAIFLGRGIERFVAHRCIRRHLRRTAGTMPA